jgi:putative alpha-1,2-fucosyltransferase
MIVIHIESGLGNQMLSYCEYLSLKHVNPRQKFYIETIIFEIPECNEFICQWNGYELEKIFGISQPQNIKTLFSEDEWTQIIQEIRATRFWEHNWNYPIVFTKVFRKHGLDLVNMKGDYDPNHNIIGTGYQQKLTWKNKLRNTWAWITLRRYIKYLKKDKYIHLMDNRKQLYLKADKNIFTGQWLSFKYRGNDRQLIDPEIRKIFTFPPNTDEKNLMMEKYLDSVNAVAIHARRGDMLSVNGWCYKYGYFRRAVKYIKKHVQNPVFVFFTDPGSIDWCKEHEDIFGLDYSKDNIKYVDWNSGADSYLDMQLMGHCKHAIITNSTFGWWGAYFITNTSKITISPDIIIDTTFHC